MFEYLKELHEKELFFKWAWRSFLILLLQTFIILITYRFFPEVIKVNSIAAGFVFACVITLLNVFIYPVIARITLPLTVFTFGIFGLIVNGVIIYIASEIVRGVEIQSVGKSIVFVFIITLVNIIITSLLSIDDDDAYYRNVLRRKGAETSEGKKPGILFLEIDGLAEPVLKRAVKEGYAPNLAKLLNDKTHKLIKWETDLSSQTGASQAGILLGNNKDIPAFRWVNKRDNNKIMTSNAPKDCPLIEETHSNGQGLLHNEGASRANLFSGDASEFMFTYSKLGDLGKFYSPSYYSFFIKPYNYIRTIWLFVYDVLCEYGSRIAQRRKEVVPRLGKKRGGVYPLLRGFTTVFLRDLTIYTLIGDIFEGKYDSIYATFVGYDEVAHHSGVEDKDTLKTLKRLDKQFGRVFKAAKEADRKYHFVILSDHGQTQGQTFKQRYGITLEEFIKKSIGTELKSQSMLSTSEDFGHLNVTLTQLSKDDKAYSKVVNKAFKDKKQGDYVALTPKEEKQNTVADSTKELDLIVLASGNLGLVYFTKFKNKLPREKIEKLYPGLLKAMTAHEGIGFVVVNSTKSGPIVIGANGEIVVKSGKVKGENPLKFFGPNALEHIKRHSQFKYVPDILVNSFYNPKTKEGAAFEELIGFHGGMGGTQTMPFVLYPNEFTSPENEILGAEELFAQFKNWQTELD